MPGNAGPNPLSRLALQPTEFPAFAGMTRWMEASGKYHRLKSLQPLRHSPPYVELTNHGNSKCLTSKPQATSPAFCFWFSL